VIKHEATSCDINSKDNTDEDGANKWIPMKIDLSKDFDEHLHLTEMKEWATTIWDAKDVTLVTKDGQSQEHTHKAFSEFIFGSMEATLQKTVQNAITPAHLWNDGP
jgi:hypothetical protein